jgi:hypothetical protein
MILQLQNALEDKCMKMRGKILHLLGVYGMIQANGNLDYNRIDSYIRNIGSNNPKKYPLKWLGTKELLAVLNQVNAMVRKELNKS